MVSNKASDNKAANISFSHLYYIYKYFGHAFIHMMGIVWLAIDIDNPDIEARILLVNLLLP